MTERRPDPSLPPAEDPAPEGFDPRARSVQALAARMAQARAAEQDAAPEREEGEALAPAPAEAPEADALFPPAAPPAAAPGRASPGRRLHIHLPLALLAGLARAVVALCLALGLGLFALYASGTSLPLPRLVVAQIETAANRALEPVAHVTIRGAEVLLGEGFSLRFSFSETQLTATSGRMIARLPVVQARLIGASALRGEVALSHLSVSGASLELERSLTGALTLGTPLPEAAPVQTDLLTALRQTLAQPLLRQLVLAEGDDLKVRLSDLRTGRIWYVREGALNLTRIAGELGVTVAYTLNEQERHAARGALSLTVPADPAQGATAEAMIDGLAAADLAAQVPQLAMLSLVDGRLSGALEARLGAQGQLTGLSGALDLAAGALKPGGGVAPIAFDGADLGLDWQAETGRLSFSKLSLRSKALTLGGTAEVMLTGMGQATLSPPTGLTAQIALTELSADPQGLFAQPAKFDFGAADLRLTFAPFRLDLGQLVIGSGPERIVLRGSATPEAQGWRAGFDLSVNAVESARLLALWPVTVVGQTRQWLAENVTEGVLNHLVGALRLAPGEEPRLSLGWDFAGAKVRVIRTLPPVEQGAGYATLEGQSYTLVLERGGLTAPQGGAVDMAGTILRVPDITVKGAPAEIVLKTRGPITAALSLLDQPPFELMKKAGRAPDLASGTAVAETRLSLPLGRKVAPDEVQYAVTATLSGVESTALVKGRKLTAETLALSARPEELTIEGEVAIDGLPASGRWVQKGGAENRGKSRVEADVTLSQAFLDTFGIGLPKGTVSGAAPGKVVLALDQGTTAMTLTSGLKGLGLAIPALGYRKAESAGGALTVEGKLGSPPKIDRLSLEAPGLAASGSVSLSAGGGLEAARFEQVDLGWFSGPVTLKGRGKGKAVAVEVAGGTADLRRTPFGQGGEGARGGDVPLSIALDRLRISESLALTRFAGSFGTRGGLNGTFTASLNGAAAVKGTVVPEAGRASFRLTAPDAGAVFRAAGLFSKAQGGSMDLVLRPDGPAGHYRGVLTSRNIRVMDAPALASLLSAASVVGLIEQMQGQGLVFDTVEGRFRLTPQALELSEGRAVGLSMGLTMAGLYGLDSKRLDMQGVISPLYLLNAVGEIVSARRGEGLVGFNYTLTGPVSAVKVSVNPLSLLTPGFFRDLFRRPPPTLEQP